MNPADNKFKTDDALRLERCHTALTFFDTGPPWCLRQHAKHETALRVLTKAKVAPDLCEIKLTGRCGDFGNRP